MFERWRVAARVVVGRVLGANGDCVLAVSVYGYPASHVDVGKNEDLLQDVFASMADLTLPVLIAGDMNTTCEHSEALSRAEMFGFVKMSDKKSSTMTKRGIASRSMPIDHVYVNMKMRDLVQRVWANQAIVMSDHYPICMRFVSHHLGEPIVRWPCKPNQRI